MKYIFVGSKPIEDGEKHRFNVDLKSINPFDTTTTITSNHSIQTKTDFNISAVQSAKNVLISIIEGLNQKRFGFDTLSVVVNHIRNINEKYIRPTKSKLFIDSGGYSIIVGDVSPMNVTKFIECYNHYLLTEKDIYDYIFSLDIPIFLNNPEYNTVHHIENFNRISLTKSIEILQQYPELKEKFYFIYQFKVSGQYQIWKKLYDELNLSNYIQNWAIGGMVGMRGILRKDPGSTDINFSPFTAIAYKSFFDYINSTNFGVKNFNLHCLGIYIKYDRFQLTLLEKLFKEYLIPMMKEPNPNLTYDSVNYMRTAQLKVKSLNIFQRVENSIIYHDSIQVVPTELFQQVYGELYPLLEIEIENLKAGRNLNNIDSFTGLNVFSNIELDKFFDWIIDEYEIISLFFKCNDYEHFKRMLDPILITITAKWSFIFTSKLIKCIRENLRITYIFNYWWINKKDETSLNTLITEFIKKIGFPGGLT